MSIKCEKCGTENEDGARFCKSCGAALISKPETTASTEDKKNIKQTLIKVGFGIVAVAAAIAITIALKEYSETIGLENKCANNNAIACYELGKGYSDYEGGIFFKLEHDLKKGFDSFAKSCKLGNGAACYEAGSSYTLATYDSGSNIPDEYYKQGCDLKDGQSCYEIGKSYLNAIDNDYRLGNRGWKCERYKEQGSLYLFPELRCSEVFQKHERFKESMKSNYLYYFKKACDYGHELGCTEYKVNQ